MKISQKFVKHKRRSNFAASYLDKKTVACIREDDVIGESIYPDVFDVVRSISTLTDPRSLLKRR